MTTNDVYGEWKLGDLRVRRMGFGAMRLFGAGSPEGAVEVVRRAVELGADHIDTAAFYYRGAVSANEAIRAAGLGDDVVVATKVGPYRGPQDAFPTGELAAGDLRGEVERNLRELGRDHLDLVYLRTGGLGEPDDRPIGERFAVLARMREEGLIRHLGVSHASAAQLAEAREIAPVVAVQNRFDVTMEGDAALLETCEREGIAYVPYFPLGGFGLPDDARLGEVAGRHGATVAQVMLAALLALSPVMLAIPGTGSLAHLEENMGAASLRLGADDLALLRR
ncbi:aldo/keto reductase [Actinomadura kijaniata]|uniref:aldo/keto reductase n=1 Tax=Actinomadura kijaniata TaxID=46161 RepID=UPI003F1D446A